MKRLMINTLDELIFFLDFFPHIQDATFCKSILYEYTDKIHMEKPTYHTVQREGLLPTFVSVVNFNGVSYNGIIGKTKKEAEQFAARAAILSVIGI